MLRELTKEGGEGDPLNVVSGDPVLDLQCPLVQHQQGVRGNHQQDRHELRKACKVSQHVLFL